MGCSRGRSVLNFWGIHMKKRKLQLIEKRSFVDIITFTAFTIIVPILIFVLAFWLVTTERWLSDPMGHCVNILMLVSTWGIIEFELYLADVQKKEENDFRIVDCMTIIFTVITICYSFLQICDPPILFSNIIKLILWFSAIIVYTILVKPTKMKVLCLCLVAVFISTLFVLPITYQEYYEEKIEMCKIAGYYDGGEYCYNIKEKGYYIDKKDTVSKQESTAMFEKLLEDEYFVQNYSGTLCHEVYSYINSRSKTNETGFISDLDFVPSESNNQTPGVFLFQRDPLTINFTIQSEANLEKIKVTEIVQNGFMAKEIFEIDGNNVTIKLENIKGLSGYKNLTFLKGFVEDADGNISEETVLADFVFYGYDMVILAAVLFIMFAIADKIIKSRRLERRLHSYVGKKDES